MLVITHNSANWQKNQNDSLNQWRFKFKLKFQSVLGSRNTPNDNNNKNNDDNNDNNVAKCSAGNGKKKCQYEPILTSPPSLLPHILMTFLVIIDFTCVALNVLKTDNAPPRMRERVRTNPGLLKRFFVHSALLYKSHIVIVIVILS